MRQPRHPRGLVVRAFDRVHAVRLSNDGVDGIVRETFASALEIGAEGPRRLGYSEEETRRVIEDIRRRDETRLQEQVTLARGQTDRQGIVAAIAPQPLVKRRSGD